MGGADREGRRGRRGWRERSKQTEGGRERGAQKAGGMVWMLNLSFGVSCCKLSPRTIPASRSAAGGRGERRHERAGRKGEKKIWLGLRRDGKKNYLNGGGSEGEGVEV